MPAKYRRINVMIGDDQHRALAERGLNVSGLIRDLVGDYLSRHVVTVQVSEETRRIYDLLVANTGTSDREIEAHLRAALAKVLRHKISEMKLLQRRLAKPAG